MTDRNRILIIGKNGQVGWELCRTLAPLGSVVAIDTPEIELTTADSVRKCVRDLAPSVIVNAAAYTAVDKAEVEPQRCLEINGAAPGLIAEEAKRLEAWLVHYSTDYVFDGTKRSPYVETDAPNPLNAYGRAKLAGEQAVAAQAGHYLLLRLCWVYGARGQNFLLTIRRLARERETLRVVRDQIGCPTWARMVAEATSLALARVLASADPGQFSGLYHLAASGETSWHAFAQAIVGLMPPDGKKCNTVQAITTAQYPTAAPRPAYSVLGCDKLRRVFGLTLPPWEDGLKMVGDELAAVQRT